MWERVCWQLRDALNLLALTRRLALDQKNLIICGKPNSRSAAESEASPNSMYEDAFLSRVYLMYRQEDLPGLRCMPLLPEE